MEVQHWKLQCKQHACKPLASCLVARMPHVRYHFAYAFALMSVFDGPPRIPLSPLRPSLARSPPRTLGPFSASPHTLMEEKSPELAKRRIPPPLSPSRIPSLSSGNDCQGDMELLSNASGRRTLRARTRAGTCRLLSKRKSKLFYPKE